MGAPTPSFVVVIDTREQKPFKFPDDIRVSRKGLRTGDYSVEGYESKIAIERKSLVDLYGVIGHGRERFVRELERLAEFTHAAVVVEASWYEIIRRPPSRSEVSARAVIGSMEAWEQRYGVPFHAYGPRALAARLTLRKLERFWKDATDTRKKKAE